MSNPSTEELLRKVHGFVAKAINDPQVITNNRSEFQAVVDAWKLLASILPGVGKIGAEEFGKYLAGLVKMAAQDKVTFNAKWQQAKPSPPSPPLANATQADVARYQRDLGKYNRMFEMYSKIMANSHEMKKALISNFPR
ncbi:MAG: hypothetical protein ABL984_15700 [Pyrinomonadaceae bacterium]